MDWERIEPKISLNDPESRFHFESTDDGGVKLTFRDWRNRKIVLQFADVAYFSIGFFPPVVGCAEGEFYRNPTSPLIEQLRECQRIGPDEVAFHYLIGSNEDEWCEIVAASHDILVDG